MTALWRVSCAVADADDAEAVSRALDPALVTVSAFEDGAGWLVEGLAVARPDAAALGANLALAWLGHEGTAPDLAIERLPARDWLSENQQSFTPVVAGRFVVRPSHDKARAWPGRIVLTIDAATAFGTGEHASTRGCLLAIDRLARRRRFARVLDMGCGTGILAMAAARIWGAEVAAFDIDPEAVRVARRNAQVNGLRALVAPHRARSHGERFVRSAAPYDLVLANILARPLVVMAAGLARNLAPDGFAVLSGLLPWQEAAVLAAHRAVGLALARRILLDGWSTLILSRRQVLP